eukprot:130406-Pleurochrysis_carterae.AAC.2
MRTRASALICLCCESLQIALTASLRVLTPPVPFMRPALPDTASSTLSFLAYRKRGSFLTAYGVHRALSFSCRAFGCRALSPDAAVEPADGARRRHAQGCAQGARRDAARVRAA